MEFSSPDWMKEWLKISFYQETCSNHPSQYKTFYCGTCQEEPVCPICWRTISHKHPDHGHQVLSVRIASRRTSIEVKKIEKFIDASEIQIYSINQKDVVYLNPNEMGRPSHSQPNCRTCRRVLKKDDQRSRSFCSIACKFQQNCEKVGDDMNMEKIEMKKNGDEEAKKTTTPHKIKIKLVIKKKIRDECCLVMISSSLRKRSRKGIPRRAAFM